MCEAAMICSCLSSVLERLSGSIAVMRKNVWLSYVEHCEQNPNFFVVQLSNPLVAG